MEDRLETVEATYGSDKGGLVWGYRFEPGSPARLVDCDAAAQLLGEPAHGSEWFLWASARSMSVQL